MPRIVRGSRDVRVKRRSFAPALVLLLVGCLDHFELPATNDAAGGPDVGGAAACGGDGQTCCAEFSAPGHGAPV